MPHAPTLACCIWRFGCGMHYYSMGCCCCCCCASPRKNIHNLKSKRIRCTVVTHSLLREALSISTSDLLAGDSTVLRSSLLPARFVLAASLSKWGLLLAKRLEKRQGAGAAGDVGRRYLDGDLHHRGEMTAKIGLAKALIFRSRRSEKKENPSVTPVSSGAVHAVDVRSPRKKK